VVGAQPERPAEDPPAGMSELRGSIHDRLLILRADASSTSGTGHVMRALALAQAWVDRGGRGRWLVESAPDDLLARIERERVAIHRLSTAAGDDEDAGCVRNALLSDPSAIAVLDGEAFGSDYLDALRGVSRRVLLIDDMAERARYPVGFVLNQNAHADRAQYPADAPSRFLLGLRFVLQRREFVAPPPAREIPTLARHLLVTFGGADPTRMTSRTVGALHRLPAEIRKRLSVRVIVGAANPDWGAIAEVIADPDIGTRIEMSRAVTDMPSHMAWADLAITSGGSTVWELARTGCPSIVVETTPVEQLLASGLARARLFSRLGPEARLDEQTLADEIAARVEDVAWRTEMSALGMRLVDGEGASRVVEVLAQDGK
jgi:UDP-2,4-diacetamido-2,4,6-trideoxy-beta-L-altropyranose hydrolase